VDVILEGQIDQEETMADVISSVVAIKSCNTPILRINDNASDLQGRLLFSQGGYIVGGKINATGESGYSAVRKLLLVKEGNYAILDPARKATADLNQALWLATEKLLPMLPNLPEASDQVLDQAPERITESAARPKTGQIDLAPIMAAVAAPKDEVKIDPGIPRSIIEEHRQTVGSKAPSRKYNESRWRTIRFLIQTFGSLGIAAVIMLNSDACFSMVYNTFKAFGIDIDASKALVGPLSGIAEKMKADILKKKAGKQGNAPKATK
jgi:hypothetical protein